MVGVTLELSQREHLIKRKQREHYNAPEGIIIYWYTLADVWAHLETSVNIARILSDFPPNSPKSLLVYCCVLILLCKLVSYRFMQGYQE